MARGFLAGIAMGGVFSVAVAGVASFVVPISAPPQISDAAPDDMAALDAGRAVAVVPMEDVSVSKPDAAPTVEAPARDSIADVATPEMTDPPAAPETSQDVAIVAPDMPQTVSPDIAADEPVFPNPMALAPMEPQGPDAVAVTPPTSAAPAPEADAPSDQTSTVTEQVVEPAPQAAEIVDEDPETPDVDTSAPSDALTATTIDRGTGVTVNRLPTALSTAEPEAAPQLSIAARAITRYSQPFANPDDKPLMSILLIDQGSDLEGGEVGIPALRSFPYPISFAVDVTLADAAERMEIYRNEGFEVLAMVDLPEGAEPSDAETTLAVAFNRVPEVVGILEGQGAGVQPSREVADQVTAILAQGGYGLVSQDKGLNTMPKLAVKEGVPAAPVFRDFDSKDQTPIVIRRFLDQAAFKAGVEGSVIMLGRMRPETISALLVWGLQDRATQVALAPISAVLLASDGE